MPPKTKTKARAFKSTTTSPRPKPTLKDGSLPPSPFIPAPKALEPFLSTLEKRHIYITHLDTHPRTFKRQIFLVPVLMNIVFLSGIIWRIKTIGPYYMKICFSLMGKYNETTIDTAHQPLSETLQEVLRRTAIFMIDLLIYIFIWPWPRDFFAGRTIGNPVNWRFRVGFQDKEIIVRRSRKWDRGIGNLTDEGNERREEAFERVRKATDGRWIREKTGYLMLNKDWDLDWSAMVNATRLMHKGLVKMEDFRTTVLVHREEFGWLMLEGEEVGGSVKEEEGRKKILAFKDELTRLGKESLFFRWIELVQFESSQPGGFGPERQQKTMEKARELFEGQGVDFDKFWKKIGGMEGMPGMDQ